MGKCCRFAITKANGERGKNLVNVMIVSTKDLLGDEKEDFMYPIVWGVRPFKVGDIVATLDGSITGANFRGIASNGYAMLDSWFMGAKGRVNSTVLRPIADLQPIKHIVFGCLSAIEYAIENDLFDSAINEGRITSEYASIIIASYNNSI